MFNKVKKISGLLAVVIMLCATSVWSAAKYRYEQAYEDTVRVMIVYNERADDSWHCPQGLGRGGYYNNIFTQEAIKGIPHVKVSESWSTQRQDVINAFAPNLPHVIAHVNGGSAGANGPYIAEIVQLAVDSAIGFVSIGDDAARVSVDMFGFTNVQNGPAPMAGAMHLSDLWVAIDTTLDVPQGNGIVTNARRYLMDNNNAKNSADVLMFKAYNISNGRCSCDADRYDVIPGGLDQLSFMGFQSGWDPALNRVIGGPQELPVIAAFGDGTRRGVALSFQPNALLNSAAAEQIVYDAIMWASFARQGFKIAPPVADPPGSQFDFIQVMKLTHIVPDAEIWYRTGTESFVKYNGQSITITEDVVIQAYADKEGWQASDTITEVYEKQEGLSSMQLTKLTGEPLGGSSNLTDEDNAFVIKLTIPYAGLTSIQVKIVSANGKDTETITISNPQIQNNALVFTDTVTFAVLAVVPGNGILESSFYDNVTANWNNPKNNLDNPAKDFPVKPAPRIVNVYFADANGKELTTSLTGIESSLYVVVEDAVFDPARLDEYVVTLTNKKGEGNGSKADSETYKLVEVIPGKYGVTVPVIASPPVESQNGNFEIRIGDELKVTYVNPLTLTEKSDIIGYGVPTQLPGQVSFTNADWTVPPVLMAGDIWDVATGFVYLAYSDDYIASLTVKQAKITIENTDAQGRKFSDTEIINLATVNKQGDMGVWRASVVLDDNSQAVSGDGKLQYYFKGKVTVKVASHLAGTSEIPDGDTARAGLIIAKANTEETLTFSDLNTGLTPGRTTTQVRVCIEDQVYSSAIIDTLLLDKIECASSGDKLENVQLIQTSAAVGQYCGTIQKQEAVSGTLTDNILHCQDIDNIVGVYSDPVYGTGASAQVTIMDPATTHVEFFDVLGRPVSSFSEEDGNQIRVRLTTKTPDLYLPDTLKVKLKSESGDTLDLLVFETGSNSGIFEAVVNIGFSETPNLRNNIIEGKLDFSSSGNRMEITGSKGAATASIEIISAYVPVNRAWIVDGNADGQADSIYISFQGVITHLPSMVTSIDWNSEGFQGYTASYNTLDPLLSDINYVYNEFSTIAILLPGVLDNSLQMFPAGKTRLDESNPPTLILPADNVFQGREVAIEDGIGAIVVHAQKHPSDDTFYKDSEGFLQKQPDTLIITLSEKIRPIHSAGIPWDSLFLFVSPDMVKADAYPLISLPGTQPKVQGPDSLVWTFIVDNGINSIKPFANDELFLNPHAPYVDASPAANRPQDLPQIIMGADNPNPINNSNIFVPVIGSDLNDPRSVVANLHVNEDGTITPGRDVALVEDQDGSYNYERIWVSPVGLQTNGTVVPQGANCIAGLGETAGLEVYPENCLSTVQIFSTDGYTAEITIFDHLGKFVHQSVQYFGRCGELENHHRRTARGIQSWLIWNQKDLQGDYVGSGVYIWKVRFSTSAGSHTAVYRQGIVRASMEPEGNCAQ
ncbi:MAG: hypothetical protein HQK83_17725 [Fibrobacteria bacterium]|nr:hypothetical protein [Fibrobacteria bacterium]